MQSFRVSTVLFAALIAVLIFGSRAARAAVLFDNTSPFISTSSPTVAPGGAQGVLPVIATTTATVTTRTVYAKIFIYDSVGSPSAACDSWATGGGFNYLVTASDETFGTILNRFSPSVATTTPDGACVVTYPAVSWNSGDALGLYFVSVSLPNEVYAILSTGSYDSGTQLLSPTTYLCIDDDASSCNTSPPPSPSISFFHPANGDTVGDFSLWGLPIANADIGGQVQVFYSALGSSITYFDYNFVTATSGLEVVNKSHNLVSPFSSSTPWSAYAFLLNASGTTIASSAAIVFNVRGDLAIGTFATTTPITGASSSTYPTIASSTNCNFTASSASSSILVSFFDPLDLRDTFKVAICESYTFLFIPNDDENAVIAAKFNTVQSNLAHKPPFGYSTAIGTAFSDLNEPTGTPSTTILDPTSTTNLAFIFTPLDQGVAAFVSFLFLVWLFHRARLFEPT